MHFPEIIYNFAKSLNLIAGGSLEPHHSVIFINTTDRLEQDNFFSLCKPLLEWLMTQDTTMAVPP